MMYYIKDKSLNIIDKSDTWAWIANCFTILSHPSSFAGDDPWIRAVKWAASTVM